MCVCCHQMVLRLIDILVAMSTNVDRPTNGKWLMGNFINYVASFSAIFACFWLVGNTSGTEQRNQYQHRQHMFTRENNKPKGSMVTKNIADFTTFSFAIGLKLSSSCFISPFQMVQFNSNVFSHYWPFEIEIITQWAT